MKAKKRTKILATIGPASASRQTVQAMVDAGVNAFRINFSHGSTDERLGYLHTIRSVREGSERPTALCADLCGPKIRVGVLPPEGVDLVAGESLVIQRDPITGTAARISTTLHELAELVRPGEKILLADGRMKLTVTTLDSPDEFTCRVDVGGHLTSGKGMNLPETDLAISALTEKDRQDIAWIAGQDFDYVALSFVRRAADVAELRQLLGHHGSSAHIIAKIEKPQALREIDAIIEAADAVMVARGDLGVEMDFPEVPIQQKLIARKARAAGKPCIIATEMLESMITQARPTRAEVSDVANAVFDMADAVMLSAESAVGDFPVQTVEAMTRTLVAAETFLAEHARPLPVIELDPPRTVALATAIDTIMERERVAAVAVFTDSGRTPLVMAKLRLRCPVLAVSEHRATARRSCLYYGIVGRELCLLDKGQTTGDLLDYAKVLIKQAGLAQSGEQIIVVGSYPLSQQGQTNGLAIVDVP